MKQSPAAVGWWALSERKHRRVPPAQPCTSPTCSTGALPTCQQTPALFLAHGPSGGSCIGVCHHLWWHPPWCSQEGSHVNVTLQHLPQGLCRGLYWSVTLLQTWSDWCPTWEPQRHRHSLMPVGTHACFFSDTSSPRKPTWKRLYLVAPVCTHSHTHTGCILAWRVKTGQGPTGLLCRISISLPDDGGGCVLSASFLNKSAEWAASPRGFTCCMQVRGGWHPGQGLVWQAWCIKYRCMNVCSSRPPALVPEASSGAFI